LNQLAQGAVSRQSQHISC